MSTIHTDIPGATEALIAAAAPLSTHAVIPMDDVVRIAANHLPHTPDRGRQLAVLEIVQGLTHVALFEDADVHWRAMWPADRSTEPLKQWGFARADAWRELVWVTATNAVEADRLGATQVA